MVLSAFVAGAIVRAALAKEHRNDIAARLDRIGSALLVRSFSSRRERAWMSLLVRKPVGPVHGADLYVPDADGARHTRTQESKATLYQTRCRRYEQNPNTGEQIRFEPIDEGRNHKRSFKTIQEPGPIPVGRQGRVPRA